MPRVAEFYGIVITMYFGDHVPPHFHAAYAGQEALIEIGAWTVLKGKLPRPQMKLVRAWAEANEALLRAKWDELQD